MQINKFTDLHLLSDPDLLLVDFEELAKLFVVEHVQFLPSCPDAEFEHRQFVHLHADSIDVAFNGYLSS